jgi:cytoskeletal protein CcmA (bactofilin family)
MFGFGKKSKTTINSLIGTGTRVEGPVYFEGGLRIDGHVRGDVIADPLQGSVLVISDNASVEGEVRAGHVIVSGAIRGALHACDHLELQPAARITGEVSYKTLEMHGGAVVTGKLTPDGVAEPILKLASSNT